MPPSDLGRSIARRRVSRRDFLGQIGLGAAAAGALAGAPRGALAQSASQYPDWMPYDGGFRLFQPHMRNIGSLAMRRTDGYGASTVARMWSEK